jgi:hypothetical protein
MYCNTEEIQQNDEINTAHYSGRDIPIQSTIPIVTELSN